MGVLETNSRKTTVKSSSLMAIVSHRNGVQEGRPAIQEFKANNLMAQEMTLWGCLYTQGEL